METEILTPFTCGSFTKLFSKDRANKYFKQGKVVFFAGGTGHPYFSTDTGVLLRAIEVEAEVVLLAKAIDGVYDSDPKVNPQAKKYDESLKNYKDALVLNPSDEVTLLKIGNVYKLKNDEKNAIDFYKKSIFVNPEYADGWFNLGLVYANENDVSESKKCFQKARYLL